MHRRDPEGVLRREAPVALRHALAARPPDRHRLRHGHGRPAQSPRDVLRRHVHRHGLRRVHPDQHHAKGARRELVPDASQRGADGRTDAARHRADLGPVGGGKERVRGLRVDPRGDEGGAGHVRAGGARQRRHLLPNWQDEPGELPGDGAPQDGAGARRGVHVLRLGCERGVALRRGTRVHGVPPLRVPEG